MYAADLHYDTHVFLKFAAPQYRYIWHVVMCLTVQLHYNTTFLQFSPQYLLALKPQTISIGDPRNLSRLDILSSVSRGTSFSFLHHNRDGGYYRKNGGRAKTSGMLRYGRGEPCE
jgi:hypothetical protein